MFQVRIVKVDHYMSAPIPELDVTYSDFRKSSVKSVPVIRIFGSTPTGVKTCVHVHGIFPYICIPYDGSEPYLKLAHQLAASLDKAINIASGYSTSNTQHVYKVVLVSGIPFYGYHRKRHQFLKIYFYKPSIIKQAVSLLQNGAILNKLFQPHEAHIPFILQFFIDFNLYGMSFIDFQTVRFRRTNYLESAEISPELILPENIPPLSVSQFEVDVLACHISNRPSSQGNGQISNPGLAAIWEDEHRRRVTNDETPLDVPQLHSQRPFQKPTTSELFFLRRIQGILESSSQSADDSSLSGETLAPTNKSYAIEEPLNTAAVDASFVSLHVSEVHSDNQNLPEADNLDDTIVDEDLALMNQTLSQRLSQTLDKSLALDYEDLELLDALETLADNRSVTVDDDSVLGSQTARVKTVPRSSVGDEEESNSEGEDEEWRDKTLAAEEDEALKLLDLTMPDFDEAAILNSCLRDENQPGPSGAGQGDLRIPQVDGALGEIKSDSPRKQFRIPQLDGMNDVPTKSGRKNLGMRGGCGVRTSGALRRNDIPDNRYNAETGDLIFRFKKPSTSGCSAGPSTSTQDNALLSNAIYNFPTEPQTRSVQTFVKDQPSSSVVSVLPPLPVPCTSHDPVNSAKHQFVLYDESINNAGLIVGNSTEMAPTEPDLLFSSQSTIQNTLSESTIQNVLSQPDFYTQSTIQNAFSQQLFCLLPQSLEEPLVSQHVGEGLMPAFFPETMQLQEQEESILQPPVVCCSSSTVGCSGECGDNFDGDDGVNAFLDEIARKVEEPVLRGDPSLYPEPPPEREESLTDLLTAALCKANSEGEDCIEMPANEAKSDVKEESIGTRVRRSSRLASHDNSTRNIVAPELLSPKEKVPAEIEKPFGDIDELEDPEGNLSPCSCYDLTGFGDTMFNGLHGVSTVEWGNFGAEASDSEMCRLSGALEKGQMEEILQTGFQTALDPSVVPTTTRRDEVMQHVLETQKTTGQVESIKMECQGTCSKAKVRRRSVMLIATTQGDPVTDELLHRGKKPVAGPPRLGKNMEIARLYCSTPHYKKTPPPKSSTDHQLRRQARQRRKNKLSITAQRKKRQSVSSDGGPPNFSIPLNPCQNYNKFLLKPCVVSVERLTKSNIHRVCNNYKVKLKDKALLCVRKYKSSSHSVSKYTNALNSDRSSIKTTPVPENTSISAYFKCSPLEVSKASILCGGKSRRPYQKRSTNQQICNANASTDSNSQDETLNVTHDSQDMNCFGKSHLKLMPTAILTKDNDGKSGKPGKHSRSKGKKSKGNTQMHSSSLKVPLQIKVCEDTVIDAAAENCKNSPQKSLIDEVKNQSDLTGSSESKNVLLLRKNGGSFQVKSVRRSGRRSLPHDKSNEESQLMNQNLEVAKEENKDSSQKVVKKSENLSDMKHLSSGMGLISPSNSQSCAIHSGISVEVHDKGRHEKNNFKLQNLSENELPTTSSSSNEVLCYLSPHVSPPKSNAGKNLKSFKKSPGEKSPGSRHKRTSTKVNKEKAVDFPQLEVRKRETIENTDNIVYDSLQHNKLDGSGKNRTSSQTSNPQTEIPVKETVTATVLSPGMRKKRTSSSSSVPSRKQENSQDVAGVCKKRETITAKILSPGMRTKRTSSSSSAQSRKQGNFQDVAGGFKKRETITAEVLSPGMRKKRTSSSGSVQSRKQENFQDVAGVCESKDDKLVTVPFNPQKAPSKAAAVSTDFTSALKTIEENAAKVVKNYKIPKKSNFGRKMVLPHSVNSSAYVDTGNFSKGIQGTACPMPTASAGVELWKEEASAKDESSVFLSLDVSGIELDLSDNNIVEERTGSSFRIATHSLTAGPILSSNFERCRPHPQSVGQSNLLGQIMCVDGAQTESSSDSSSGTQCKDQAASSSEPPPKRKCPSRYDEVSCKSGKMGEGSDPFWKGNKAEASSWQPPQIDTSHLPKSVAHWFAQPYGPWSLWSPNSSPNAHHHAHLFSPPRAESPEKPHELSFCGFSTSTGCMEEKEAVCAANDNRSSPPANSSQDLFICSQSTEPTSKSMTLRRNNFEEEAVTKNCSDVDDSSLGKRSHEHSILDIFSDKSFDSDNSKEEDIQSIGNITSIHLATSPTSNFESSLTELASGHSTVNRGEEVLSTPFKSLEHKKSCKDDSHEESLWPNEPIQHDSMTSRDSVDLPCGQQLNAVHSWESVPRSHSPSRVFRPLQKPPSRKEVIESLTALNLPVAINPEPFYSNPRDVKGKVEVGGSVLDLTSKRCLHLEEFYSSISGLQGISSQQRSVFERMWGLSQIKGDFDKLISNHSTERTVAIAPVKKPPKVRDVNVWVKARHILLAKKDSDDKEEMAISQGIENHIDSACHHTINTSLEPLLAKPPPSNKIVPASTPDICGKKSEDTEVPSPLLTPILQDKSQFRKKLTSTKSKTYLKTLGHIQSPLPSITEREEDDMGVKVLEENPKTTAASLIHNESTHDDSSLNRLLSDSQFCRDIDGPTFRRVSDASACQVKGINASQGFKMNLENLQTVKTLKEHQYISVLTMEVHVCTCGTLNPDPERDPIRAIFYTVCNDVPEESDIPTQLNGILAVNFTTSSPPLLNRCGIECAVEYSNDEKSLVRNLVSLVHRWDPDILAGFEIEMQSWGYVLQRACVLGVNLIQELSRIPNQKEGKQMDDFEDNNGFGGLKITGRIVLDVWRVFRSEVALQSYTFENLMYHVLHERISHHSFESLSRWWENLSHLHRWMTVRYYQSRVRGIIRLLDQLDIIGRTSELARLFGIQFFEVLSRGSQFRVESMMLRLAKPMNYIPVSPSVQQRAHMRAPECLPLIMEPESRFYKDPLIVLDFQSLYPSMIIAYNYCFSTCLGRVEHLGKSTHFEFGCSELRITNSNLKQLKDNITVSPSGVAFVTKAVRQGILPKMLEEILEARLAVKQSMKQHKDDRTLQRVLHARQLGLKLIANVTYGYTSANFSGRMPCIEVGDSVVSKGRETLERAISLVHSNSEWQARVVYGDTDSLFVLVPGRSRQEAFRIGAEIASAVTQDNPSPVKLKLEKVYQPSILQTKKRYVGFMYESPDQKQPIYEAKGIETVRRDGCPAVSKMLEKSLRILFETCDVSSVKNYVTHQFSKILAGRANIQDLIYAREFRGKENYRPGACVPALELTKRWLRQDRRAEPRIGERVPYVIVNGPPGSALIHLVRHPNELLSDPSLRYNAVYYVTRAIIPPLARCLSLLGADVAAWYADLPRRSQLLLPRISHAGFKKTISQYFTTMECACCSDLTHGGVCMKCRSDPQLLVASLMSKLHSWESTHLSITKICQSCLGRLEPLDCCSLDCPITYRRHQSSQKKEQSAFVSELLNEFLVKSSTS